MGETETGGLKYMLLLVGKTGSGKSATGNTILGDELFDASPGLDSVTSDCQIEETERDGAIVKVVDSPGLFDTSRSQVDVAETIVKMVAGMSPGPDAFLYTVNVATRFTDEDFAAYQRLKAVFDDRVSGHVIAVFTHGDALEKRSISIDDFIISVRNPNLRQVLEECNHRYVVFNNEAEDPKPQVRRLLQTVKELKTENQGHPYSCPKYAAIEEKFMEEVARRLAEVEERELENKKTVQDLKQKLRKAGEEKKKAEEEQKKAEEEKKKAEEEKKKAEEEKKKAEEEQKKAEGADATVGAAIGTTALAVIGGAAAVAVGAGAGAVAAGAGAVAVVTWNVASALRKKWSQGSSK